MPTTQTVDLVEARRNYTPKADLAEVQRNYKYDLDKFLKHSSTKDINDDPEALRTVLASAAHSIEKGLAFEAPRAGFGASKIPLILAAIDELERTGNADIIVEGARGCLRQYVEFHDLQGWPLPAHLESDLRSFVESLDADPLPGGAITLTKNEIMQATDFDYERFIRSRYSVRHFTGEAVSPEVIQKAVGQAIKTPRVCNRETRKVYAAHDPELRNHLLTYHHGNSGFGHKLGAVLIVTVDLRGFDMIGERNQPWIDGGLFAMSLAYALHAARLGTCMMNWSEDCDHDQLLRKEFNIPDNEVIITFLGVGHVPEVFEVAASPAPDLKSVLSELTVRS